MSITHFTNRWLNRLYKSIAIFFVILAVLISALRVVLPYAHHYTSTLQTYINKTYDSDVRIGSLAMRWDSAGPRLIAKNVILLQTDMAEVDIKEFSIIADFWRSVLNWQLVTKDFSLNGVNILFDRTVLTDSKQDIALINNISELFLNQINHFSLENSQLIILSEQGQETFFLSHLKWLNQGGRHLAKGDIHLDGLTSNNLIIRAELEGKKIHELSGLAYIEAHQLNITPWLAEVVAADFNVSHSSVNFNAWLDIDQGVAKNLQVQLAKSQLAWHNKGQPNNSSVQTLEIVKGHLAVEDIANKGQLKIRSTDMVMAINDQPLAPFSFFIEQNKANTQAYLSAFELVGLSQLLPLFVDNKTVKQLVHGIMPEGELSNIFVNHNNNNNNNEYAVVADISMLSSAYYQGIPGIKNLSGQLISKGPRLQLSFTAQDGDLDFKQHFVAPIKYQSLTSTVDVFIESDAWQLSANQILFTSELVDVKAELFVKSAPDENVSMALLANVIGGNVTQADVFYPQLLMGNELINYLNNSLVKGQLAQTQVLFNGPLDKFPFKNNEGVFVVDAELIDSSFKFDSEWPSIDNFNANLNFTNNQMLITGRSGSLSGIDIKGVEASIADLADEQKLLVEAQFIDTSASLITELMNQSALADTVGLTLNHLTIDKTVSGDLHLTIPLNDPDNSVAKGRVDFKDNSLSLLSPNMEFSELNGSLFFKNGQLHSDSLDLVWRDLPLNLQVKSNKRTSSYVTDIALNAVWQNSAWQAQVPEQLLPYGRGTLEWQGNLEMTLFDQGNFQYALNMASDLVNMHSYLPAPYDKEEQQRRPITIAVNGSDTESVITAMLDDSLNFYGKIDHQSIAFTQAHLVLGKEQMLLPTEGFYITSNLEKVSLAQWQPFIKDIMTSVEQQSINVQSTDKSLLNFPKRVRGDIGSLDIFGQKIHQVSFDFEDQISWRLLEINAEELRANIKFYPDWQQQGIDIDADFIRLELADSQSNDESSHFTAKLTQLRDYNRLFTSIPPTRFRCQACKVNAVDFGKVSFNLLRKKPTELVLENFIAQRADNILHFQVNWLQEGDQAFTAINGDFSSKDIETEIERLGFSSTIRDSRFDSSFSFDWQGSPFDFTWPVLNGKISALVGEGVLDVDDEGARLLSLFSLKTLVRKLKLDFRDIFSDGMFFEELKGDFTIDKGVLYTKNTAMKGAAGDLSVKGNTNLVTEQLDYSMYYKPNYSANLPALAWIATLNPVTFLAGVALDGMITSQVVSEIKFEVTGDITAPSIKKIAGKNQTISVVGRDSPPQIVENSAEQATDNNYLLPPEDNQKIKPDKEKSSIKSDKKSENDKGGIEPVDG